MAEPVRHRQTKEAATDMFDLQPPRHIPTLPKALVRGSRRRSPVHPLQRTLCGFRPSSPPGPGRVKTPSLLYSPMNRWRRAMSGFVEGVDRGQSTLFPAQLDDYVAEDNPVRAVDVFVDGLDLDKLGFVGVQ